MASWYKARIVAQSAELAPAYEPGLEVAVSVAQCGVRVWAERFGPHVITLDEAKRALATERDADGRPLQADSGRLEALWSFWFSGR